MGKRVRKARFRFAPFSNKQLKVLTWWMDNSPVHECEGIIADGAIRSGKTLSMSMSFVIWAMKTFRNENFGMCGKTIGSFRRNVLTILKIILRLRGYKVEDHRADNLVIVTRGDVENYFYIFGGKDERSQDLIQGITLAGCFFDEVALMPESFVNQATGRCSVDGSRFWFNCNPGGPNHWFKVNWIDKAAEKNLLYLHFTMDDNNALSERIKERYRSLYEGVFYQRYILGLWVIAEGIIYTMFNYEDHVTDEMPKNVVEWTASVDYGTRNPFSCGIWAFDGKTGTRVDECYYSPAEHNGVRKTDEELYMMMDEMIGTRPVTQIIVDPSAASFIECIKSHGKYSVLAANNDVLDGIRIVSTFLTKRMIRVRSCCEHWLKEVGIYAWKDKKNDTEEPVKESDHAMDDTRYYCNTYLRKRLKWRF